MLDVTGIMLSRRKTGPTMHWQTPYLITNTLGKRFTIACWNPYKEVWTFLSSSKNFFNIIWNCVSEGQQLVSILNIFFQIAQHLFFKSVFPFGCCEDGNTFSNLSRALKVFKHWFVFSLKIRVFKSGSQLRISSVTAWSLTQETHINSSLVVC